MRTALIPASFALLAWAAADVAAQSFVRDGTGFRGGFASAIVLDGDRLFATRPGEIAFFPSPANHAGTVHVFMRSASGEWVEQATVTSSSVTLGDGFGNSLAVAGDVMVVGAPKAENSRGAAYVFERNGGAWREVARLVPESAREGARFGAAVAIGGADVFVGMPGARNRSGSVLAYRKGAAGWAQAAMLAPGNIAQGDEFGASIAARGDRLVVGGPGPLPTALFGGQPPRPGAAWIFTRGTDGSWRSEARLAPEQGPSSFGQQVVLAGDDVLISAPFAGQAVGAVVRFSKDAAGSWTEAGRITGQAAGTGFGMTLALAGGDLFVGTPLAGGTGGAEVYRQGADGGWSALQSLPSAAPFGFAGSGLAANDRIAVVGAPGADYFEGFGLVYTKPDASGRWALRDTVVTDVSGLDPITGGARDCQNGEVGPFKCADVELVSFLPVSALGGKRGMIVNDLWGWTDSTTNREYAIVGRADGTVFIDVTDPANPVYLGELPLTRGATPNLWRDIKVYKDHAFIVADGVGEHGVQVFDLTQLRNVQNAPVTFTESARYDRIHSAHNIVMNESTGFAYVVGASMGGETCGGGLHMIDVREPKSPKFAGCFADVRTGNARTGYSHDAQCITYNGPDTQFRGREICFGSNETALSIADVTDKSNPTPIATAAYPNVAYLHQGWVSDDHRYLFMNDEGDELAGSAPRTRTLVWDITELEDPILVKEYMGTTAATDHNLYVRGTYVYESNYVSGLRILDISDPTNPVEVGWFDTVPWGEDVPGFAGSWSNYPYFNSGIIVVTSMREGVFVLRYKGRRTVS